MEDLVKMGLNFIKKQKFQITNNPDSHKSFIVRKMFTIPLQQSPLFQLVLLSLVHFQEKVL